MGPQGIFKPRVLHRVPLSITTAPAGPYDDAFGSGRFVSVCSRLTGASARFTGSVMKNCRTQRTSYRMSLVYAIQHLHGSRMVLPSSRAHRPGRDLLEIRYEKFRQAVQMG